MISWDDVRTPARSALTDAVTVTDPAPWPPEIRTEPETDRPAEPRSPRPPGPATLAPGAERVTAAWRATAP
ncbi:hypothetical protein GCM10023196_026090 [Actinoallomurus vinaceus]|uniref:Uncharacterized protein n=1 Tax=Actinoallomurus vinaceus TaxID=1080074 RepID=A0ABP8UAS1_9ACTN